MKRSPILPVKLENPLGCGVEGLSRYKPKDRFPYTVIPKAPGFKIGKFKYPDQELLAIKAIANDKERLYRHYFGYFIQKVNNVLKDVDAPWHVVGVITPSFDYVVLKLKNISTEDAAAFNASKYSMLTLMDQYRDNVYITNEYMTIERASLDPAVEDIFKCRFKHWLLFIPSALKFVSLDEDTFDSLFDYRDATMDDMNYDTKFSITFTDMEGNPLEHCTPIALTPDEFNVRMGYDCSFTFSVESEQYEVNKIFIENEELVPENNVYHIHKVTKDIIVKVCLSFGEFALDFTAINCVLARYPKRVNRDTEYKIPFAAIGSSYDVKELIVKNPEVCECELNKDTGNIILKNITGDVEFTIKAHDMVDITLTEGNHYIIAAAEGFNTHTERYHEFKFVVNPDEGYIASKVYYKPTPCKECVLVPKEDPDTFIPTYTFIPMKSEVIIVEVKPINNETEEG